ncbi:MAG: YihY/virulence factor BrkB family protein [Flavobacteriales bacterium]
MFRAFVEDNTFDLGAALAYYTIFSIIPLLVVVIAVSGFVAGPDAVRGEVFQELNGWVGEDTARSLETVLGNAYISGRSWIATVIGIITLIVGATGIFNALKNALNRMWEIQPRPKNTVVGFIISRLLSFSFVMGLGFLLIVTFTLNAAIDGLSDSLARLIPAYAVLLVRVASWLLMFGISTLVFACVFKYLPSADIRWKDVLPGADLHHGALHPRPVHPHVLFRQQGAHLHVRGGRRSDLLAAVDLLQLADLLPGGRVRICVVPGKGPAHPAGRRCGARGAAGGHHRPRPRAGQGNEVGSAGRGAVSIG